MVSRPCLEVLLQQDILCILGGKDSRLTWEVMPWYIYRLRHGDVERTQELKQSLRDGRDGIWQVPGYEFNPQYTLLLI